MFSHKAVRFSDDLGYASYMQNPHIQASLQRILGIEPAPFLRVGIDGCTGAGKTSFAKALVASLRSIGREVVYVALDDFHNPKSIRYQLGRESAEGYFRYAFNFEAIRKFLLEPLTAAGSGNFVSRYFDLEKNSLIEESLTLAKPGTILIAEGSFAIRKELRGFWDFKIYLNVPRSESLKRVSKRDAALFGSEAAAAAITKSRYIAAHDIYEKSEAPIKAADLVIANH